MIKTIVHSPVHSITSATSDNIDQADIHFFPPCKIMNSMMNPITINNYIDGVFESDPKISLIPSYNPSTGSVNAFLPDSGGEQIEKAVQAARRAYTRYAMQECDFDCLTDYVLPDTVGHEPPMQRGHGG